MDHAEIAVVESLVVSNAGQSFRGKDFRKLIGPGVYVFLCNDLPIYVGMSNDNLLGRASSNIHHQRKARKEATEVRLFPCVGSEAAAELEEYLIFKFQPKYNKRKRTTYVSKLLGTTKSSAHLLEQYAPQVSESPISDCSAST